MAWHGWANLLILFWVIVAGSAAIAATAGWAPGWLAVHAFGLGAVTTAIVIWSEHFAVALLHTAPVSRRASSARLALLTVGQAVTVAAAVLDAPAAFAVGAGAVTVAVGLHGWTLLRLRRRSLGGRLAGIVDYYLAACVAFLAAAVGGAMMGTGIGSGWHERLHTAHEHLTIGGWVLFTVVGTLFMLWPTVLRTQMDAMTGRSVRWCLRLTAPGLFLAVAAVLAGWPGFAAAGMVVYAAGVVVAAIPLARTLRRKWPASGAAYLLAASMAWLVLAVVADAVLLAVGAPLEALGPVVLVGVVGQVLLGSLTYLLPVVVGGGPAGARSAITLLDAYWPLRVAGLNAGVVFLAVEAATGQAAAGRAGWALIGLTVFETLARIGWLLTRTLAATRPAAGRSPVIAGTAVGAVITVAAVLVAMSGSGSGDGGNGSGGSVALGSGTTTVDISLRDMRIDPGTITVPAGGHVILRVTNHDSQAHDVRTSTGRRTPMLAPHRTADLDLGVVTAPMQAWCTVPGHRAGGMRMTIAVTDHPATHPATGHAAAGDDGFGAGFTARDATLPPAAGTTVHRVELPIVEAEQEVAPGVRQKVWTFGGSVPGPTLRGKVGDTFEITLINRAGIGHGIDFHAGAVAPDAVMRTIQPGERLVYTFRAERAGIWLYHCSTSPMTAHMAAGMVGAVIIDPPELTTVDREFALVASELYTGAPASDGTMAKQHAGTPDGWTFNGTARQYDRQPLTVPAGQRVRIWVVNAGPGSTTAFHVVGAQFDTVYKEGAYQLRSGTDAFGRRSGGAQVLDLAPAQGGYVEMTFTEPGTYAFVDHDMRHAEAGAHGIIKVIA